MRTIRQVAKASGLSVRALHHDDRIGLLTPGCDANGYRRYGQPDLLRLQRILFYRELGLPLLPRAGSAARGHRPAARRVRLRHPRCPARSAPPGRGTDRPAPSARPHPGPHPRRPRYRPAVARPCPVPRHPARHPGPVGDGNRGPVRRGRRPEARAAASATPPSQLLDRQEEIDSIHAELVALIDAGVAPAAAETQALIGRHHHWVSQSWRPDGPAYAGLGRLYVEHPDFRATFDALHPDLATFLAHAMLVHADTAHGFS